MLPDEEVFLENVWFLFYPVMAVPICAIVSGFVFYNASSTEV